MVRVLLVYTNEIKDSWVPIGLLYIAAYLRENKIAVKIVDTKYDNVLNEIMMYDPHFVGLGGMTVMSPSIKRLGESIKEKFPFLKIVVGGVHYTFLPDEAKSFADYIIRGEAEEAFVQIVKRAPFYNVNNINIQGVSVKYYEDTWYSCGERTDFIKDLDLLPLPAYDLIDMNRYSDELVTGEKAISILTGRGCPYNCSFCASPSLWQRKVRYHSIDYVIRHIKYLIKNYNLQCLRIMDDTLTCNNERVQEFCRAITSNGIELKMTCLTNVNNADFYTFFLMKRAGFDIVAFGLESADKKVLSLVNKNNTIRKMRRAVRLAHKAGLRTELLFMVGNVGETEKSLRKSLRFAKSLKGYKTYFQLATPFPGSKFYDEAEKYGIVVDRNWEEYNHKTVKYVPFSLVKDKTFTQAKETMIATAKKGTVN
jgi:anaerobic magnesium-protoporphyrin IX monomethyl ester cyclase